MNNTHCNAKKTTIKLGIKIDIEDLSQQTDIIYKSDHIMFSFCV